MVVFSLDTSGWRLGVARGSGNRDNGDDILLFPPRTRSHVNVPVTTSKAMNMILVALLNGAHVRRMFRRREDVAQAGIP